jgi:transposase-like protein
MSVASRKHFHDETAAFEYLEGTLWPTGPVCPHCGTVDRATKLQGKATRIGVWKCNEKECRKQFTVKVGTVFEHGRLPLHKMLQAVYLLCCSKKGCSAHQLHRILQITYKSAWFLAHRIREAMRDRSLSPMGGEGEIVEIDETFCGFVAGANAKTSRKSTQFHNVVSTLVHRGGSARSFHVAGQAINDLLPIIRANLTLESAIMTDAATWYKILKVHVGFTGRHETVNHKEGEYVRPGGIHTNTVEGYYSIFKRGMRGVYQHCSEKHLHRYLAEFDFRYSNRIALGIDDTTRADNALKGIVGKRLTYRAAGRTAAVEAPPF